MTDDVMVLDTSRLNAEYNRVIEGFEPRIREIHEQVHGDLERRGLMYGGKVMKTFLRPSLVTRPQIEKLEHACNVLIGAVDTMLAKVFEGSVERMGSTLGIGPEELEVVRQDPGYSTVVAINRMDGFLDGDRLTFLEFNSDSPAGIAYSDECVEVFQKTPCFAEFARSHRLTAGSARHVLLDTFRLLYQEWGQGARPLRIAIVDWKGVVTSAEFVIFQEFFERNGIPCIIADPRDAELRDGVLSFGGFEATFVYRRVIAGELLAKKDEVRPFLEAYRQRAACFVNSFRSRLADNKAIFSIFSDPALAGHFSAEERAVFDACIPWTRRVVDARTSMDGREVDLLDHARRNREDLVLKANISYGGKDVVIGWESSEGQWDEALETALRGNWVVQKRARIPEEIFPVVTDAGLTFEPRKVNINPFALGGRYGGCVCRLSTQSVINVAVGGGAIPVFVVED